MFFILQGSTVLYNIQDQDLEDQVTTIKGIVGIVHDDN